MRRFAASCLPLLLLLPGCAGTTMEKGTAVPQTTAKAANAPVVLRVPGDPLVSTRVWFDVGSSDDPVGKEGLAYVTGQLLEQGATAANKYEAILEKLYPIASSYGVRVDKEMTTLSGRTHRDTLDSFLPLFLDAYLHPAFPAEDFERVRSDTLNYLEKTLRYASDEELGKAALQSAVFTGTGYAHPPQGTVSGLKSLTLEDVRAFYKAHFTRDRTVVAVGGDVGQDLLDRLQKSLAELPATAAADRPLPPAPKLAGRSAVLVAKPGADASISFGFPIDVPRGSDDFYALWIANSWLGEHRNQSSHLYQVIREARGLNYGDYSYIEAFPEGGQRSMPPVNVGRHRQLFEVWIRTLPNPQGVFALRAALRELQDLIANGMTQEEFALTRDFLGKYALHFAPTTFERLGYAVDDRFYGIQGEGHLARFRERMRSLTVADVNAALKRHLQADNLTIAIVTGEAETIQAALTSGAPTPITYASPKPDEVTKEDPEIAGYPLKIAADRVKVVPVEKMFE
jgi:zinc protease